MDRPALPTPIASSMRRDVLEPHELLALLRELTCVLGELRDALEDHALAKDAPSHLAARRAIDRARWRCD